MSNGDTRWFLLDNTDDGYDDAITECTTRHAIKWPNNTLSINTNGGLALVKSDSMADAFTDGKWSDRKRLDNVIKAIFDRESHFAHAGIALAASSKLRWRPPVQRSPTTLVPEAGVLSYSFANNQDVIVAIPDGDFNGSIFITGGRHVRVIGGHIISAEDDKIPDKSITLKPTGSAYFEGLIIDRTNGDPGDAIVVSGIGKHDDPVVAYPDVYIQNCRILGIFGSGSDPHGDLFQAQGTTGNHFVDKLTATTDNKGLFFVYSTMIGGPAIRGDVHVSRTNFHVGPLAASANYYWFFNEHDDFDNGPGGPDLRTTTLHEVYAEHGSQIDVKAVMPQLGLEDPPGFNLNASFEHFYDSGHVYWAANSKIHGVVREGNPPGGDFVAAIDVGSAYTSPGYF